MRPSPAARVLARSLLAIVCGGAACTDREAAEDARLGPIGAGGNANGGAGATDAGSGAGSTAGSALGAGATDGGTASGGAAGRATTEPATGGAWGSAGAGGMNMGATTHPCLDPQPSPEPGVQRCADGSSERIAAATCATPVLGMDPCTASPAGGQAGAGGVGPPGCASACTAGPYGQHRLGGGGAVISRYECEYFCASDADCPSGRGCACGEGPNGTGRCLPGECGTSADCPSGETCRLAQYAGVCGQGYPGLFCVGKGDACVRDADCPAGVHPIGERCASLGADLLCMGRGSGGCGRPILVADAPRIASLVRGVAWAHAGRASSDGRLGVALRGRQGCVDATCRHASVAYSNGE